MTARTAQTATKHPESIVTRSDNMCKAKLPAPGCRTSAANLLARVWNESSDLRNAQTLGAAKLAARKFSKCLVKN